MTAAKRSGTHDWVAIRRAYEEGDGTIDQICERFGVSSSGMEYRARRDQWTGRRPRGLPRQEATLARLFAVLEKQVSKLANVAGDTLGDKEAQQLTELVKNFDKIANMANSETRERQPEMQRDMKDLRDKLAKRIDQFKRR